MVGMWPVLAYYDETPSLISDLCPRVRSQTKGFFRLPTLLSVLSLEQAAGSERRGSRSTEEGRLDQKP